jgi:hypothetical protein
MTMGTRATRTRQADLPVDLSTLDPRMLDGLARAAKKRLSTMRLSTSQPYPEQVELNRAGAMNKERCVRGLSDERRSAIHPGCKD